MANSSDDRMVRLKNRIDWAMGNVPVDLVLKNGKIVNVFSGKIIATDLAIAQGKIIGLGKYEGDNEVDLKGAYVIPGLVDAHMHMESTLVTSEQMARIIVPRGTTTVIANPHEIANVCGIEGIKYMIDCAEKTKEACA